MFRASMRAPRRASSRLFKSVASVLEPLEARTLFSSAAFVKIDTTTQGNWSGVYGADGYSVIGAAASLPSYATYSVAGNSFYEWEVQNSSDVRGLQTYPGSSLRVAATDYSNTSLTYDVNISDGKTHQVAFYLLDADSQNRSETVTITDASSGTTLASNDVSSFSGGDYVVYNISGNVNVTISNDAGSANAVNSGVFFDPGPGGSSTVTGAAGSGSLLSVDATTRGSWTGVYGADGYSVVGGTTSLPAYATFGVSGNLFWQWEAPGTSDLSALQVKAGDTQRTASSDFTTTTETFDLNLTGGQTHQVALYVQDESNQGRTETVTVSDATSGTVLSSTNVSNFSNGEYLVYDLSGNVDITLTNGSGSLNALASGLFFDPGRGNTVSGTVFLDGNSDGVQGAGEAAVAGATVTVADPYNNVIATTTADSNGNYSIGDLPPNEQLTLIATAPGGWIGDQAQVTLNGTPEQVPLPASRALPAPSALTATSNGDSEVDLSWTTNTFGAEEGFHVYESVDGGAFSAAPIATVASGTTSVPITGLSASHDYVFEVAAFDAYGDSTMSNTADAAAPGAPTGLVVESWNQDGQAYATLAWNASDPSPAGTTYSVYVSQTPNSFTDAPVASGLTATTYTYGPYDASLTLYFKVTASVPLPGNPAILATAGGGSGSISPPVQPPEQHALVYYLGVTAALDDVEEHIGGGSTEVQVFIPAFDPKMGTETGSDMLLQYTAAAMFWAPFENGPVTADVGVYIGDVGWSASLTTADGLPAFATHTEKDDLGPAPTGNGGSPAVEDAGAGASWSATNRLGIAQAYMVGFIQLVYWYNT